MEAAAAAAAVMVNRKGRKSREEKVGLNFEMR